MSRFLLPLLLASFSLAGAELVMVECSDGQAQFLLSDLLKSKCLRITKPFSLPGIDAKSLGLFIKLSKLNDAKIFAFIDSLSPDEFRVFDYYAKYLRVYHELDALFKYKCLKEYGIQNGDTALADFVTAKFAGIEFVEDENSGIGTWQHRDLFAKYLTELLVYSIITNPRVNEARAFFVLLDFYQQTIKKPMPINADYLKKVFASFDADIQNHLIQKNLVIV